MPPLQPPLHEPDKPAHHIIERNADGSALRNDGQKLAAAETNKWYIMMTAAGVPDSIDDKEIIAANRRLWNGWACGVLPREERTLRMRITQLMVPANDLAPLTMQEQHTLTQALRTRLGDNTVNIPDREDVIDFSNTYFLHPFYSMEFYIPTDIKFDGAVFNGGAHFNGTMFNYRTDFEGAVFNNIAYFYKAMFYDNARFNGTVFNNWTVFKGAKFYNLTNFEGVVFNHKVHFDEAMFNNKARFNGTVFNHLSSFYETVCNGRVEFRKVTFHNYARFNQTVFKNDTNFSDSQFLSPTDFTMARFKTRVPKFYQTQFHEDTAFTTDGQYWPKITKGGIAKALAAENRIFKYRAHKGLIIKDGAHKGFTIKDRAYKGLIIAHKGMIIQDRAAESKRAYIRLRQQMNHLQKRDDEHFFYRQEMDCKALLEGRTFWLMAFLFKGLSDYGYSVVRPLSWLGLLILLCGGGYWGFWGAAEGCRPYYPRNLAGALGALGQSISTSFPFFGFQKLYYAADFYTVQPAWLRVISGFQTVISFMLIFLLGLGLRNRFRLK